MNFKSTKRALISAALALLVCVSMLIGTTFAWFTDSVTSGRNIIQSGNLDVDLLYSTDGGTTWDSVEGATDVFAENLWEPGFTKVVLFKVANNGSLALRYEMNVSIFDEVIGKNVNGDDLKLSNYISGAVLDDVDATRDEILALPTNPINNGLVLADDSFYLAANTETNPFAIALWMPTSVGNEANHDGVHKPSIELGVSLFATQKDFEADSFGTDYDKMALVGTAAELQAALSAGESVMLNNDITLTDAPIVVQDNVTIDLNGNTLTGQATGASASKLITVPANKTLTLTNGTVSFEAGQPDTDWGANGSKPFPGYANNTINCSGTLVIDGATIRNTTAKGGASYAIDCYAGANLIINNGVVDGIDKIAIRMFAGSATVPTNVTINGGTISGYRAVWVQLPGSNTSVAPIANLTVNGGKLISTDSQYNQVIYSYSYGNDFSGTTIALNGGEFYGDVALGGSNGVKYGKENITVDTENCVLYGSVYSYNTDAGFTEIAPNAVGGAVSDADDLSDALENGGNVVMIEDVEISENIAMNGGTLNGNGNTLDAYDTPTSSDCAVTTTGGKVENLTIVGDEWATRALGSGSTGTYVLSEDLYISNVYIDKVMYAINGSGNGTAKVVVTDSTVYGWISYSNISSFEFTNCTLGIGNSYDGYMVVYGNTSFTDCTFETFDMCANSAVVPGSVITFTNCYNDGEKVTVDNFKTLFMCPGDDVDFNKLSACTIIIDGETLIW